MVTEKAGQADWKNLNPSSSTSVVVLSPGSTMAGAESQCTCTCTVKSMQIWVQNRNLGRGNYIVFNSTYNNYRGRQIPKGGVKKPLFSYTCTCTCACACYGTHCRMWWSWESLRRQGRRCTSWAGTRVGGQGRWLWTAAQEGKCCQYQPCTPASD